MKKTAAFRLSQTTKRMMATLPKGSIRNDYKRVMTEAQLVQMENKNKRREKEAEPVEKE